MHREHAVQSHAWLAGEHVAYAVAHQYRAREQCQRNADLSDDELAELEAKFLADGWGDRRPIPIEQPFELVIGGRLVRGRIDAVYAAGDGALGDDGFDVIDYKTGAVPADFAAASLQLSVYRLAWADLRGVDPERVSAGFLYVRTGMLKRPDRLLSRDDLAALFSG